MSSSGRNGGGLNSDDQSKKVTSDPNETVSSPVRLSVPCEDVHLDEDLLDMNNQDLLERIARANQFYLAEIVEENQQLSQEVLKQTMKNNAALAKQSELYEKLILGASKSIGGDCIMGNPPDTNVKPGGKRLLGQEETSEAGGSKKMQKLDSEEDPSSEDQKD